MRTGRPYGPARVLKSSKRIPWGYKAVWLEDYRLDNGRGSSASSQAMSELLGMTAETITSYRERLQRWGLYTRVPRGSGLPQAWHPVIPASCHPAGDKVGREELIALGAKLDSLLPRRRIKGKADPSPVPKPDQRPVSESDSSPVSRSDSGPGTEGVGGAVLPLTYKGEAQLRPVVTGPTSEDGVGAIAPQGGSKRLRIDDIQRPMSPEELSAFEQSLKNMSPDKAARLRRVAGGL